MIGYRSCDARFPFLWEDTDQPPARWHGPGAGPVQYLADTPTGAWAEFIRHEEIRTIAEMDGVRRALWAVEIGDARFTEPNLEPEALTGAEATYPDCQNEAARLRARGVTAMRALSGALVPGGAAGYHVDGGLQPAGPRDGWTLVLFGARPDIEGWSVALDARPDAEILRRVRSLGP